jgi:hypothetical protein
MPGPFAPVRNHELEYSLLRDVTDAGPVIGFYAGKTIAERVVDEFGRSYVFCGIASRSRNGKFDVATLAAGEFILRPGLVYRYDQPEKRWWSSVGDVTRV